MFSSESQTPCPERCFYCPGLGLDHPLQTFYGIETGQSCAQWPMQLNRKPSKIFYPSKWLSPNLWSRLEPSFSNLKEVVILLGDNDFCVNTLVQITQKFKSEIWVIPHHQNDIRHILSQLPKELYGILKFYAPLSEIDRTRFLTAQDLHGQLRKLTQKFPEVKIQFPEVQVFNSTLSPTDLMAKEQIVYNSTGTTSPKISVIIPSYNNYDYLERVVSNLKNQTHKEFEVIVVDDGSTDGTSQRLVSIASKLPQNLKIIYYPRTSNRKMGDFQFRAGRARSVGVKYSNGEILAFLDSDILVPPNYIEYLCQAHLTQGHDVVQIQRVYLKEEPSKYLKSFDSIDFKKDAFHPEGGYWKEFFEDERPWETVRNHWKYVCTYGLSVRAERFKAVGGFNISFNSYGFEDTDLGYRLSLVKARFHKADLISYHLWHTSDRSEFSNSPWKRKALLKRSANLFFRQHLDPRIFEELQGILIERRAKGYWTRTFRSTFARLIEKRIKRQLIAKLNSHHTAQ